MSRSCSILLTLYATSFVAFVSQYSKSPRSNVIWYGELLYTCSEIISSILWMKLLIKKIYEWV